MTGMTNSPTPSLSDISKHLPPHVFHVSTLKSIMYFLFDTLAICACVYYKPYMHWSVFTFLLGFEFWKYFLIAHDCGHGVFSNHEWVNTVFGNICKDRKSVV